jgi:uncharacterized cupin superfamily protein
MRNFTATTPAGQTHVLTSAADVTEPQKSEAKSWPIWDSTEDFKAQKQPKFVLRYRLEERVLILSGSAQLSPTNGDPPFVVSAGDACTFRAGFVASWVVTSPMRKHYHYFDAAGELCAEPSKTTPVIACDAEGCGKECVDESYSIVGWLRTPTSPDRVCPAFPALAHHATNRPTPTHPQESEDVCPKCVKKARGPEKRRYEAAVRCELGAPAPETGGAQPAAATAKRKSPPAAAARSSKAKA